MNSKLSQLYLKSMDQGRIVFVGLLIALIFTANFPQAAYASGLSLVPVFNISEKQYILKSAFTQDLLTKRFAEAEANVLVEKKMSIVRTMKVTSTAYSSTVDQCDSTPCIAADGYNVCANGQENVVAANFLKFGTKIKIPELYGDKIFTVHDRMHSRFSNRVDLWKLSRESALQYGKRTIKIEILG